MSRFEMRIDDKKIVVSDGSILYYFKNTDENLEKAEQLVRDLRKKNLKKVVQKEPLNWFQQALQNIDEGKKPFDS